MVGSVGALERTFDITMQLSFRMEILETPEELTDNDGDVLFSEDAGLHLRESMSLESGRGDEGGAIGTGWETDQIRT